MYSRISETDSYFITKYVKQNSRHRFGNIISSLSMMAVLLFDIILTAGFCHYQEPFRLRF